MNYRQALAYLSSFINYEKLNDYNYNKSFRLERVKSLLDRLGNPQDGLRCIHVAGTKGKGSTCVFIAYILREAGFKTGLYTSPHLSDFRERIRILNPAPSGKPQRVDFEGMISAKAMACLATSLRPVIDRFNSKSGYESLSFFEVYTALAFVYFKSKKVDFAVLETGIGGRLDATNAANALVCAITPISYEHTDKLGRTIEKIAAEKAGIIKNSAAVVISSPQEKAALDVIRKRCAQFGARLYEAGRDISYKKTAQGFNIKGLFGEYKGLKTGLKGEHQLVNASVAVGAVEALRFFNIKAGRAGIKRGISRAVWPARCEVLSQRPLVILDGAQNAASVEVVKKAVAGNYRYRRLVLVLGISGDKDIKGICAGLRDFADYIILTKSCNPRAADPKMLAGQFKGRKNHITDSVPQAMQEAFCAAGQQDLILACGSLFVAGEFRDEYRKSKRYNRRNSYAYRPVRHRHSAHKRKRLA